MGKARSYQQNPMKISSEFLPNSQIAENVFLSKFLGKNPLNFVHVAAPKIVRYFFSNLSGKIRGFKILRIFNENFAVRTKPRHIIKNL